MVQRTKVLIRRIDCWHDRCDVDDSDNLGTVVDGGLSLPKEREKSGNKGLCAGVNDSNLYFNVLPQADSIPLWLQRTDHAIVRQ